MKETKRSKQPNQNQQAGRRERERETSSLRNGRSTRVNQKGAIKQVGEVVTWVRKVCVGAELMPAWICISCNGLQWQPRGRSKWKTSIDTDRLLCCPSVFSVWFKRPYFPKKKPTKILLLIFQAGCLFIFLAPQLCLLETNWEQCHRWTDHKLDEMRNRSLQADELFSGQMDAWVLWTKGLRTDLALFSSQLGTKQLSRGGQQTANHPCCAAPRKAGRGGDSNCGRRS